MICSCLFPISRIPNLFAPLNANLAAVGNISGNLSASAQAAVSAALNAAAVPSLNAALNASAVADLTAIANFVATFRATFRIDLLDPFDIIAALLNQLLKSLATNGFPSVLAGLPFPALPKLLDLQLLANGLTMPSLAASANLMAGINAGAQLAASLNAAANLAASANLALMLNAKLAVKAGFGVNLAAAGSIGLLGGLLDRLNANLASPPMADLAALLAAALLAKAIKLLDALSAIKKAFGIDLLKPGAGKALGRALGKGLDDRLTAAKNLAKSKGKSKSASKSKSHGGSKSAEETASRMVSENFDRLRGRIPPVPQVPNLLALLLAKLLEYLGLDIIQYQPCGKKCLFALPGLFLPLGCLCPKVELEVEKPKLDVSPAGGVSASGGAPSTSASGTAGAGGLNTSSSATGSGSTSGGPSGTQSGQSATTGS
jgi:hypothetical protein